MARGIAKRDPKPAAGRSPAAEAGPRPTTDASNLPPARTGRGSQARSAVLPEHLPGPPLAGLRHGLRPGRRHRLDRDRRRPRPRPATAGRAQPGGPGQRRRRRRPGPGRVDRAADPADVTVVSASGNLNANVVDGDRRPRDHVRLRQQRRPGGPAAALRARQRHADGTRIHRRPPSHPPSAPT